MRPPYVHATIIELLERYPSVTKPELDVLVVAFRKLSALDMALLLSDEELGPKLNRFRREHASKFRTPFRDYAVFVAMAVVGLLVTVWAVATAG